MKKQTPKNYFSLNIEELTDAKLEAISGGIIVPLPPPTQLRDEFPRPGLIVDLPKKPEEPKYPVPIPYVPFVPEFLC